MYFAQNISLMHWILCVVNASMLNLLNCKHYGDNCFVYIYVCFQYSSSRAGKMNCSLEQINKLKFLLKNTCISKLLNALHKSPRQ
jgi:hypothetical protein